MTVESSEQTTLVLKRTFAAPREKVFRAWTNPAELKKWFHVEADWSTPIAEVDLRVGGKYRLGMQDPNAPAPYVVGGVFHEIKAPEKLVYTWKWEGQDSEETQVTILFRDLGGRTEVELIHEKFPSSEERDKHGHGWAGCLDQFARLF